MPESFDPYRLWLGIPPDCRPPTHYQLLGISPNEHDPAVINAAVMRQSAYVRNFQIGKYVAEAAQILNEIAAAKACLLDAAKRAQYDAELARQAKPSASRPSAALPPAIDLDQLAAAAIGPGHRATATRPLSIAPRRKQSTIPWYLPVAIGASLLIAAITIALVWGGGHKKFDETAVATNTASVPERSGETTTPAPHVADAQPQMSEPGPVTSAAGPNDNPEMETNDAGESAAEPPPADVPDEPPWEELTKRLNDLASWTIVSGQWTQAEDGLHGQGDSSLRFNGELPASFSLSLKMTVIDSMRPRIIFQAPARPGSGAAEPGFWIANEGFERTLYVYGPRQQGAIGAPRRYAAGEALEMVCRIDGRDFEFLIGGESVARCQRSEDGPVVLSLSAGDGFSPGRVVFSGFKLGSTRTVLKPPDGAMAWSYGYVKSGEDSVARFVHLPYFNGSTWQGGIEWPDPQLDWLCLNDLGGHPGRYNAVVRRWVAPSEGMVSVTGTLKHLDDKPETDGVRGRIVAARSGIKGKWRARAGLAKTDVPMFAVAARESVDFVVDCLMNESYDIFEWPVTIELKAESGEPIGRWNSVSDFIRSETDHQQRKTGPH